uniref:Synaptobrevin family protein, expressed n=2 Tax=Oryza TaxID=4527 RepID=Q2QLJ6_ORYSJ|nr:Synaptobrevin family protein, expressed [Oryza sativa Japonica Group]
MAESKLIYAMVARGTVVLAEHTAYAGNFRDIAAQCLQKLPAGDNRLTYTCDAHTFNFLIHQGYAYCVVATESSGRQIPLALLDMIKEDFNKRPRLGEQMKYCMDHPEEVSKLAKVKAQVSEVKGIMMENIDKAADFRQQGTRVRRKMWYQNMKIKLIVLGIIIALILIIILSVCHGFKC